MPYDWHVLQDILTVYILKPIINLNSINIIDLTTFELPAYRAIILGLVHTSSYW